MSESSTEQPPVTAELLTRYVRDGGPVAFGSLTRHYYPLVLAAALRRCEGRQSLAEDAAQQVFIDLARRAPSLQADERLGGWLHQRALRAAGDIMKSETRRRRREAVAAGQLQPETAEPRWADAAPLIDAALQRLSPRDRDAVLLRCVEGRDFRDVGTALCLSDDAAQKCVSRALEKLRTLLRRRGVVPAITVLTAGLAADHARAAGFSGAAAHTAAHALQSAATASTASVPLLLHAKAAAAGVALACVAWAWPIAQSVRKDAAAATPPVPGTINQGVTLSGLRPLRFPSLPRMTEGLTVDELVAAIAALAPLPVTESSAQRFDFFSEQLKGVRAGEALQKMRAAYSPGLMADVDRKYWRNYLLQTWGRVQPFPALDYAWTQLPLDTRAPAFEGLLDAIHTIVNQEVDSSQAEVYARWLADKLIEACQQGRRGYRFERISHAFQEELLRLAINKKSRTILAMIVPLVNDHRLNIFDYAGGNATDVETLELLTTIAPQLVTPVRRAALMEDIIERLASLDFPAARKLVEQTPHPEQRLIYARKIALPPHISTSTSDGKMKRVPQENHKKRADWLLGLVEDGQRETVAAQIANTWLDLDAPWALEWLSGKLPSAGFLEWLEVLIRDDAGSLAAHGPDYHFGKNLPLLLERRRRADPQGAAAFIEKLRADNQRWSHAAELNALLDAP